MLNTESALSPLMQKGRADARELMASAARIVRKANQTPTADAGATLSTAFQLVMTTALVDGYEPHTAYSGLMSPFTWSIMRLSPDDQEGVMVEMVQTVMGEIQRRRGDQAVTVQ